jgi:hypothetical protein
VPTFFFPKCSFFSGNKVDCSKILLLGYLWFNKIKATSAVIMSGMSTHTIGWLKMICEGGHRDICGRYTNKEYTVRPKTRTSVKILIKNRYFCKFLN